MKMINRLSVLLLSCTIILLGCFSESTTVFIDNYSGRDISLTLDGKDWIKVKDNTSLKKKIEVGQHKILLFDLNQKQFLDSMKVKVIKNKQHVLNLLGGATYHSDASILIPKGELDLEKILGGGEFIKEKFFIIKEDYAFDEIPSDFNGISQRKADQKTYLRRRPAKEVKSYQITDNDYWRREVSGKKMENLSNTNRDKVYDIIRNDKVCESIEELSALLENDLSTVKEKCSESIILQRRTLEDWLVEKNRINQSILSTIMTGQISDSDKNNLATYIEKNDFNGYFDALAKIDPQVNNLVLLQSRYNRLNQIKLTSKSKNNNLQYLENRLRHVIGFKTVPIKKLQEQK